MKRLGNKKRKFGEDVSNLVGDVRRVEKTSRKRDRMWPFAGDKIAQRQLKNTMGYKERTRQERKECKENPIIIISSSNRDDSSDGDFELLTD